MGHSDPAHKSAEAYQRARAHVRALSAMRGSLIAPLPEMTCLDCLQVKHVAQFNPSRGPNGASLNHLVSALCKSCRHRHTYLRGLTHRKEYGVSVRGRYVQRRSNLGRYGITPEQWDAMFESQGNRCAICRTDDPGGKGWATDHDHACCPERGTACGKCIRGILCGCCNTGIGLLKDSPTVFLAAADYVLNGPRNVQIPGQLALF